MNRKILLDSFLRAYASRFSIYLSSFKEKKGSFFLIVKDEKCKYLAVVGNSEVCNKFEGDPLGKLKLNRRILLVKLAPLTHHNLSILQDFFSYLKPSICNKKASFGTGDRLGVTTPAHVRAFEGKNIFPVLAQQSIRENERTGRSLQGVLDDALWGCFEAGYDGPFGADADHVKEIQNLKEAVDCGYTMFTVDSSDLVKNDIDRLSENEKRNLYETLPEKKRLEKDYLGKTYSIGGKKFYFDEKSFRDIVLIYYDALKHIVKSYKFLKDYKKGKFDFEVSFDETLLPTSYLAHIFIAEELHRQDVDFQNLALHFCGDWQKGIDYIGDVENFSRELSVHARFAKEFGGYKLSLHSGSDKFSVYPVFAKETDGHFHIKTAGTSYLEAIRIIARRAPSLYREIHQFALERFEKDRTSYHVTTDISRITNLNEVTDDKLESFLNFPDSRQLLHITFGSVLTAKDSKGEFLFRDRIYRILFENEDEYYREVSRHIGKHLELLTH